MRLSIFLILILSTIFVDCHVFRLGNCPEVETMKNFDMNKFLGLWYIVQRFRTSSNCVTENYTKDESGDFFVRERMLPIAFELNQKGRIEFPEDDPAKMLINFPISHPAFGKQHYWVLMTDYNSYAAIWSCKKFFFGHRQSAQIMSRKPKLDIDFVRKIRRKFESFGINEHEFSFIEHESYCDPKPINRRSSAVDSTLNQICDPKLAFKIGPIKISTR